MNALLSIGWFALLLLSIYVVYGFVGAASLVSMFPEGRRWWLVPAQLASLGFFAAVVLNHPF